MPVQQVGRPLKRLEDPLLITGRDPYVADVPLERARTMAVVRSRHAHAELTRIDVGAARAMPGVVAVLTGEDVNADIRVINNAHSGTRVRLDEPARANAARRRPGALRG
jgi:CO/xanthine dehydrogenase Mo-binding subunit